MPYTNLHQRQSFLQPTPIIHALISNVTTANITIDHPLPYGFMLIISVPITSLSARAVTPDQSILYTKADMSITYLFAPNAVDNANANNAYKAANPPLINI